MTEVDIWIKVFDKLHFKFIEEYCSQSKINFLVYRNDYRGDGNYTGDYRLYFNRETDEVLSLFINNSTENQTTKQLFVEENKSLFREVKLLSIMN